MTSSTDGRRRFEYHAWATHRLVEALVDEGAACAVMAHACTADRVWLLRIRRVGQGRRMRTKDQG